MIVRDFSAHAKDLRSYFDLIFEKASHPKRFVWDHWVVDEQYRFHRTPAYYYFPKNLYKKFHLELLNFGREVLGCYDVTPPWLSYYTDGDFQNVHADIPHGPWAFVFSLTAWKQRKFSGGETFLMRDEMLDYWNSIAGLKGLESNQVFQLIPPRWNQLSVFDPRLPHGVREVKGVTDPRRARLVIHGWFKNPEPYVKGPMSRAEAAAACQEFTLKIAQMCQNFKVLHGTQSLRLEISPKGRVGKVQFLTNTLKFANGQSKVFERTLIKLAREFEFPHSKSVNHLTLPLIFKS